MSFEARNEEATRDQAYLEMKKRKARIEAEVSDFMSKATNLHNGSPLQSDKDEVIAQRDSFILTVRTSLGI